MKIFVEQVVIDQGVLVYSNYFKFTDSEDEEGSDFEYDFEAVYANVDNIQATILKLYGAQGLVNVFNYFAEGRNDLLSFESLSFEENSPLRDMIAKIVNGMSSNEVLPAQDIIRPKDLSPIVNQPTDSIFLLSGLLAGLPIDEDLNVMRMLGGNSYTVSEVLKSSCLDLGKDFGFSNEQTCSFYSFVVNGLEKIILFSDHTFMAFTNTTEGLVVDFPSNEIQEKTYLLFNKYINIKEVSALKSNLIIETEFNQVAKSETNESLPNYLILYNVGLAKFESKEKH